MNAFKVGIALLASTAALTVVMDPAHAIRISVGGTRVADEGFKSSVAGAVTVDFNNGSTTNNMFSYSGLNGNLVQGSVGGQYATPEGNTTRYMTISPRGTNVAGATGEVTINFAKALDYFGLYWGSIDTHNEIDFFSGSSRLATFTGRDATSTPNGSWTASATNRFVNFFGDGKTFDRVVLRARGVAFESDNHAYRQAVPEPFTIGGTALVLVMGLRARKKKAVAQGEA